jgi:hypothetical protein
MKTLGLFPLISNMKLNALTNLTAPFTKTETMPVFYLSATVTR